MKNIYLLSFAVLLSGCAKFAASTGSNGNGSPGPVNPANIKMAWVTGPSSNDQQGIYGTQGSPSTTNSPGARIWTAYASDPSGNLWMFGGEGLDGGVATNGQRSGGDLNDLWMFSSTTQQWTWVNGSNMAGQLTSASGPGARHGSVGWCDLQGNFWLYGGNDGNYLNEFWKYTPSDGQWKLVNGSPSPPPPRMWSVSWTDTNGDLWLFGGQGASGITNDLWKYSISQNVWTQISGTNASPAPPGVYGTKGSPSVNNTPGARRAAVGWSDTHDNLWLFGGDGADASGTIQVLNDLWRFSITDHTWTWMDGSSVANPTGHYGTIGIASPNTSPGGRSGAYTWTDKNGNLWLFGGQGNDANSTPNVNALNDLWVYSPRTGEWTWSGGKNSGDQTGQYGVQGAFANSNIPGARKLGAAWVDSSGNLLLFGGAGFDRHGQYQNLSDVWKIEIQ